MRNLAVLIVALAILAFGCVGGGGRGTPEPTPSETPASTATPRVECTSDADCIVMGCANQWCVPAGYPQQLPCEWKDWYACLNYTTCGCVDGTCAWKANQIFVDCKRSGSRCPPYTPPTEEFVSQCRAAGGEPVALPDQFGCFVSPICSTDINCTANASACPLGFGCDSGRCVPAPDFCGGLQMIGCPPGQVCVFNGNYEKASGACRMNCSSDADCGSGMRCEKGFCAKAPKENCSVTGCPPGLVCTGEECISPQGLPCGGANMTECPPGYYCLTSTYCREGQTCMDLPGTCDATDIPIELSRLCKKYVGGVQNLPVTGIGRCRESEYFQVHRANNRYGYANASGEIFRECGASAPPADPICGRLDDECGGTTIVSCDELEKERFIHCPPPFKSSSSCPNINKPVCALALVGSTPALRTPRWVEFPNGCLACGGSNQTMIVEGFWEGRCPS